MDASPLSSIKPGISPSLSIFRISSHSLVSLYTHSLTQLGTLHEMDCQITIPRLVFRWHSI